MQVRSTATAKLWTDASPRAVEETTAWARTAVVADAWERGKPPPVGPFELAVGKAAGGPGRPFFAAEPVSVEDFVARRDALSRDIFVPRGGRYLEERLRTMLTNGRATSQDIDELRVALAHVADRSWPAAELAVTKTLGLLWAAGGIDEVARARLASWAEPPTGETAARIARTGQFYDAVALADRTASLGLIAGVATLCAFGPAAAWAVLLAAGGLTAAQYLTLPRPL